MQNACQFFTKAAWEPPALDKAGVVEYSIENDKFVCASKLFLLSTLQKAIVLPNNVTVEWFVIHDFGSR